MRTLQQIILIACSCISIAHSENIKSDVKNLRSAENEKRGLMWWITHEDPEDSGNVEEDSREDENDDPALDYYFQLESEEMQVGGERHFNTKGWDDRSAPVHDDDTWEFDSDHDDDLGEILSPLLSDSNFNLYDLFVGENQIFH